MSSAERKFGKLMVDYRKQHPSCAVFSTDSARWKGLLTDGRLCDFDELAEEPYAPWCSRDAVAWLGGEVTPFQANVPVVVGGVVMHPGQYVFCDSSGAER